MMDDEEPSTGHKCTRILYFIWRIFRYLFTHVVLVTLVVAYCLLGAVTFESLEKQNEITVKTNMVKIRDAVTDDIWDITSQMKVLIEENWTTLAVNKIKLFENNLVLSLKNKGWDGSEDAEAVQWTFAGALFYSIIVITTIGYGHIAPKTRLGKVTTIFYAIVGIPLMLLCLSNIGTIMANSFRFIYWKVCCYTCTKREKRRNSARRKLYNRHPLNGTGKEDMLVQKLNTFAMQSLNDDSQYMYSSKMHQLSPDDPDLSSRPSSIIINKYALENEDIKSIKRSDISPGGDISRIDSTKSIKNKGTASSSEYGEEMQNQIRPVPIWLCVFLVISYIVAGAFLFSDWENWGYGDSAYFCFITLTTIGFGDFVPAQRVNKKNGEIGIALCSLYLLFGIALLAMSFNLVQEEVINNVKAIARHLGIIKDDSANDYYGD